MTEKQIEHIITMADVELEMNGSVSETTSKLMLKALKYTTKYDMLNPTLMSYDEMSQALRENGWEIWYHKDNWIMTEWREQGKKIDMMGRSTKRAFMEMKKNSV